MSEEKLVSPLLDQFVVGQQISNHHGVCCCPAMTRDTNKRYIVKIISIPASQVQVDALLLAGAYSNKLAALSYFKELADDVAAEAEILKNLSRYDGFVSYDDLQIVEMDEGKLGYQVYLLSPYKLSLERHTRKNPLTQLQAVNLGLDLCASMVMARRAGYLYVDLKPGNIFINEKNEYCVGDLGFVRLDSLKYASLPDKYRSAYTAPELDDVLNPLNETVDTYAIGMVLYQIYNDGKLPVNGESVPPAYADYEMAEIIMKAIHVDPQQRWQDPMEMGQALVAYMQRNSVNDVPIIPLPETPVAPAEPEENTPVEAAPEIVDEVAPELPETEVEENADLSSVSEDPADPEIADDAEIDATPPVSDDTPEVEEAVPADPTDLTFMDTFANDETAPSNDTADSVVYEELSNDTSDILAQADALLAMEVPDPVLAPEPIEIPIPDPIVLDDEAPETVDQMHDMNMEGSQTFIIPGEETADSTEVPAEADDPIDEAEVEDEDDPDTTPRKKSPAIKIIAWILTLALLIGGAAYGYYYYNNVYLQHIDDLEITGFEDTLTVTLDTKVDASLLTINCSDTYGNTITGVPENGVVVFKSLSPDTIYKVTVSIDGFHELRGKTSGTYTTPAQTKIVQFEATAGNENGSVILTFAVDGKDTNTWTVTYGAEGEAEKSQVFAGHILIISDLTPGKTYQFTLSSNDDLYLVGNNKVTYAVAPLVFAENLIITGCTAEGLTVVWDAPANAEGILWRVRCYNDSGYNQTIETTDLTVTFTEIDPSKGYTVEVTAENMSTGVFTYISARSASITGSEADISEPLKLTVTWTFDGDAPLTGWLVTYGMKGSDDTHTVLVTEPSITVYPAMPKDDYEFTVVAADGITVLNNTFTHTAGSIKTFSGYGITADNLSFNMCKTPSKANWTWKDLSYGAYTDTFKSGEKASFVVKVSGKYQKSNDYIDIIFIIRDENMDVVCTSSTGGSWTYLWDSNYCALDIPVIPTEAGRYSIEIYFNGMAAARDYFTIK